MVVQGGRSLGAGKDEERFAKLLSRLLAETAEAKAMEKLGKKPFVDGLHSDIWCRHTKDCSKLCCRRACQSVLHERTETKNQSAAGH